MQESNQLARLPAGLSVRLDQSPRAVLLHVEGDIDLTNTGALEQYVTKILDRGGPLVLDLGGVRYMDSKGFELLYVLNERCRERGIRLVIVLTTFLRRLADIILLDRFASLTGSCDEALRIIGE